MFEIGECEEWIVCPIFGTGEPGLPVFLQVGVREVAIFIVVDGRGVLGGISGIVGVSASR